MKGFILKVNKILLKPNKIYTNMTAKKIYLKVIFIFKNIITSCSDTSISHILTFVTRRRIKILIYYKKSVSTSDTLATNTH